MSGFSFFAALTLGALLASFGHLADRGAQGERWGYEGSALSLSLARAQHQLVTGRVLQMDAANAPGVSDRGYDAVTGVLSPDARLGAWRGPPDGGGFAGEVDGRRARVAGAGSRVSSGPSPGARGRTDTVATTALGQDQARYGFEPAGLRATQVEPHGATGGPGPEGGWSFGARGVCGPYLHANFRDRVGWRTGWDRRGWRAWHPWRMPGVVPPRGGATGADFALPASAGFASDTGCPSGASGPAARCTAAGGAWCYRYDAAGTGLSTRTLGVVAGGALTLDVTRTASPVAMRTVAGGVARACGDADVSGPGGCVRHGYGPGVPGRGGAGAGAPVVFAGSRRGACDGACASRRARCGTHVAVCAGERGFGLAGRVVLS